MKTIKKLFYSGFFSIILLTAISLFIAIKNYIPGTWLTGWDNLHPEFDLLLNIKRSISASWQEYQGLGLLGGMAHAADLPRQLVLLILSIAFKSSDLRYIWTFLMLTLGPIGTNLFIRNTFNKHKIASEFAGFAAGIFYLLNLATVQTFYTPFEAFVSFYGFFPWLIYSFNKYLHSGKRKNIILFSLISVLATPAFYVQTLFVVYLIVLLIFS